MSGGRWPALSGWVGGALLAVAGIAFAAGQVDVVTNEPSPDAAYRTFQVDDTMTVGEPGVPVPSTLNGDMDVQGDLAVQLEAVDQFDVAPSEGPGGGVPGLRAAGGTGYVGIGSWPGYRSPNGLSVYYSLMGRGLLAFGPGSGNTSPTGPKYLFVKSFQVPLLPVTNFYDPAQWLGWRALFGAKLGSQGAYNTQHDPAVDPAIQYAPMRVESGYLMLGTPPAPPFSNFLGLTQGVLVAADPTDAVPDTPAAVSALCNLSMLPVTSDCTFLQVGSVASHFVAVGASVTTWSTFSSREYKTDIQPLGPADLEGLLQTLKATSLYRFHYKGDAATSPRFMGIIAEEAPEVLVGPERRALKTVDALAFVAATIKGLHAENAQLRQRLEALRRRQAALRQAAKMPRRLAREPEAAP